MRQSRTMKYVGLPKGIATCSGPFDHWVWESPRPRRMVFPDFDLFFITKGSIALVWPDGQRYIARQGSFVLIPPLVPILVSNATPELEYWFCHFNFRVCPASYSTRIE